MDDFKVPLFLETPISWHLPISFMIPLYSDSIGNMVVFSLNDPMALLYSIINDSWRVPKPW